MTTFNNMQLLAIARLANKGSYLEASFIDAVLVVVFQIMEQQENNISREVTISRTE